MADIAMPSEDGDTLIWRIRARQPERAETCPPPR